MTNLARLGFRGLLVVLIWLTWWLMGCGLLMADSDTPLTPREAMRTLVVNIAQHTRTQVPGFLVIAQNGDALLAMGDSAAGPLASAYVDAIDGLGREGLFYGYTNDNEASPVEATNWMLAYLDRAETVGVEVLVIDYCWDQALVNASYSSNAARGFASFAAPSRELDAIPEYPIPPFSTHSGDVFSLSELRNFLYLINPWQFDTTSAFVDALAATDYDALILDLEFESAPLSSEDVNALKVKANGGTRLVLCYLSIGEAEDYRSYWNTAWATNPPEWLLEENPAWPGNYPVQYWNPEWSDIVFDMLDVVLDAGFDGVYLDRVDVYEEFEN